MKYYPMLGFLLPLFSACHTTADPTPVTTIALHITANSPGIAPSYVIPVHAYRIRGGQVQESYGLQPYKQDQVDETRVIIPTLDSTYVADSLEVSVGLPGPYVSYTITGFAQIEVLVNGQVRKTVRVDRTTPLVRSPYLIQAAYLPLRGL
jgi:hypothetical protein